MPKLTREAAGYIAPQDGEDKESFAQCGACKHWIEDEKKCEEIPELSGVDGDDSCDYYAPKRGLTAKEAGFVKRLVQCHRCEFSTNSATHCNLYDGLNEALAGKVSFDPAIEPNACCDFQTPKSRNTKRIAQAMNGY